MKISKKHPVIMRQINIKNDEKYYYYLESESSNLF